MPGTFRRSPNGLSDFEEGPTLFTPDMRHSAVLLDGDTLHVFYSNAHDNPERILHTRIRMDVDWRKWETQTPETLLTSETDYEGADCPVKPSERGAAHQRVHQLRDPCIFREDDRTYLLYSIAGEHGIAVAEISDYTAS